MLGPHRLGLSCSVAAIAVFAAGCFDPSDTLLDDFEDSETTIACNLIRAADPIAVTEGEGAVRPLLTAVSDPSVVARGATLTLSFQVEPNEEAPEGATDGEVELVSSEGFSCSTDENGDPISAGVTDVQIESIASGAGSLLIRRSGEVVSRFTPTILDPAALTLELADGAPLCGVGQACTIEATVADAAGTALYADEDFSWRIVEGDTAGADLSAIGSRATLPTEVAGTIVVEAQVLGFVTTIDVTIAP
ncbi:MAG: hypothetical protein HOW73_00410 [Polyangiaceae bacterium]|nr:hypothetical protein [Polyangiaceae bacterium]